jgi:thioesterase domain-containing protein
VFRAVLHACAGYRPPRVNAPILVIRAADGTLAEFAGQPGAAAPDLGWSGLTTAEVSTVTVPGTHHTLLTDPHVAAVAGAVAARWHRDEQ